MPKYYLVVHSEKARLLSDFLSAHYNIKLRNVVISK